MHAHSRRASGRARRKRGGPARRNLGTPDWTRRGSAGHIRFACPPKTRGLSSKRPRNSGCTCRGPVSSDEVVGGGHDRHASRQADQESGRLPVPRPGYPLLQVVHWIPQTTSNTHATRQEPSRNPSLCGRLPRRGEELHHGHREHHPGHEAQHRLRIVWYCGSLFRGAVRLRSHTIAKRLTVV